MRKLVRRATSAAVFGALVLHAQNASPSIEPGKLAFVLPAILDEAVALAPSGLQPTLRQAIQPRWVSLNSSVAGELSNLPNPSPASAVRFTWDPVSGILQATSQSLGPVLTERAETIGKDRVLFAVTNQNFSFDRLDKLDLRGFEVAYPLEVPGSAVSPLLPPTLTIPGMIVADAYINVKVNETIAHFTYGLAHWLDATITLPMVTSSVNLRGGAALREMITGSTLTTLPTQVVKTSSTGIGDAVLRLKANLTSRPVRRMRSGVLGPPESRKLKLAVALDCRIPTGDELDYHGAGAFGVKALIVGSMTNRIVSPHVNVGFQFNGRSYLASQYPTEKRRLPSQMIYAAGFDSSISRRLTASFDILDQMIISGQRTLLDPFNASDGKRYTAISFDDITRHEYNAAAGFKMELIPKVVLSANLIFRLNDAGLRARVVPLVGVSYLF